MAEEQPTATPEASAPKTEEITPKPEANPEPVKAPEYQSDMFNNILKEAQEAVNADNAKKEGELKSLMQDNITYINNQNNELSKKFEDQFKAQEEVIKKQNEAITKLTETLNNLSAGSKTSTSANPFDTNRQNEPKKNFSRDEIADYYIKKLNL